MIALNFSRTELELLVSAILAVVNGGVFVDVRTFALLLSLWA